MNPETTKQAFIPEKPYSYLLESVLVFLLIAFPLGIIPVIYASRVGKKYNRGDYDAAYRLSKKARLWTIICTIIGVIGTGIWFWSMLTGA